MKKSNLLLSLCIVCMAAISCSKDEGHSKSLVILFDNDVHCSIDGYAKIAGLRDAIISADSSDVLLVSCGDFISGGYVGAVSKGDYAVEVMNTVHYDAVTIGDYEFDYGMPRFFELMKKLNASVTCANFMYRHSDTAVFAPYVIRTAGSKRVAFIGCSTPSVMEKYREDMLDEQGKILYHMRSNNMNYLVQQSVNKVRSDGADYVVVLSHLGEDAVKTGCEWTSIRLINGTYGIDAVLDGHSHSIVVDTLIPDANGKYVHLSQTGSEFANIGTLWIGTGGDTLSISLKNVHDIPYSKERVAEVTNHIYKEIVKDAGQKVGYSEFSLIADTPEGGEVICCEETNLGDFAADAFAYVTSSEIGFAAGGTIKSTIAAGDILKGDVFDSFVYADNICKLNVTGRKIRDFLNLVVCKMPGKSDSFPQVSGLKFTVDLTGETPKAKDIMIYDSQTKKYGPIDPAAFYETALNKKYVTEIPDIFRDCEVLSYGETLTDCECVIRYLGVMPDGVVSAEYKTPMGRINVVSK